MGRLREAVLWLARQLDRLAARVEREYDDQGDGWYTVLWCEGYDSGGLPGARVIGAREALAWADTVGEAMDYMRRAGAEILRQHGGRGVIFVMAPGGYPCREMSEAASPAEPGYVSRMSVRSPN